MQSQISDHEFDRALAALTAEDIDDSDKIEMLVQIAIGIQRKPKTSRAIHNAITLYDKALELSQAAEGLGVARIRARKATALQALPDAGTDALHRAQAEIEAAIPLLKDQGSAEETAEAEMNLGLIIQSLASIGEGQISDAIGAYQRALKVFGRQSYPAEYAILHNNLATAYLSIPATDERGRMREALAVQSFEEALKVVTLVDQPAEYAMLQNNLGNALQYVSSAHAVENNLRALEAYDQALRVRTATDTPLEYANTLCNKANCLRNLPDQGSDGSEPNRQNLHLARDLYREARDLFEGFQDDGKVAIVADSLRDIEDEITSLNNGRKPDARNFGAGPV